MRGSMGDTEDHKVGGPAGVGAQKSPPEDAQRSHEGPVDSTGQAREGGESSQAGETIGTVRGREAS